MGGAEEAGAARLAAALEGHDDRVWHVSWSPCGALLASCGADKVIRIWRRDAATDAWACVATLEDVQSRTIRSCEFSPCGSYLAAASFDSTTVIWQRGRREEGASAEEWECVGTLEGHENEVKSVSWSHDGSLLATCSRDKSIWIWEAPPATTPTAVLPPEELELECVSVLSGHSQDVKFVKWHPHELLLFSASYDDSVRVWAEEVDDWACQDLLQGHQHTVWGLAIEPSGRRLATCSQDCTLRLWSRDGRGKYVPGSVLEGRHERTIFSIDWSPDGDRLASCGGDDKIVIHAVPADEDSEWAVESTVSAAHDSDVNCVRFNPANPLMMASAGDDGMVKVWALPKPSPTVAT